MISITRAELSPNWASDAATAPAVAVLMHGYGSNERDLTALVPALGFTLPWVSLRAPVELGDDAACWFPIVSPGDPDEAPVREATDAVWDWVDTRVGPAAQVIPIGFSQGGLMVSQLLRTRPERVLAPVVLGGFVLGSPQPGDAQLAEQLPPLFWGRGAEDRVITTAAVERTAEFLPKHSTLTRRLYPGLAHSINVEELSDVRDFLGVRLGGVAG